MLQKKLSEHDMVVQVGTNVGMNLGIIYALTKLISNSVEKYLCPKIYGEFFHKFSM